MWKNGKCTSLHKMELLNPYKLKIFLPLEYAFSLHTKNIFNWMTQRAKFSSLNIGNWSTRVSYLAGCGKIQVSHTAMSRWMSHLPDGISHRSQYLCFVNVKQACRFFCKYHLFPDNFKFEMDRGLLKGGWHFWHRSTQKLAAPLQLYLDMYKV